ncbi:hypothetical protein PtrV1_02342 [Pyrenophora tritici-repentis]|nr:hypothetical protein PtrV1_02342 [Pyrenophora tritici-repentis]PWO28680.1 PutA, NAD-dependent aldehyde dehydrogenase [Pyrenophora tritici-repentis]
MARSVTTAFNNPEDDILQVELYKDNACTELYELQSQLTCIANDDNNFNSYRVTFRGVVAAKRSPQQIQREIDEMMGSEVSLEARADDEYLGPPKKYDISLANTSDVQIAAIPYNHPYIAASYWTVTHGLSYFSLVKGCQGQRCQQASQAGLILIDCRSQTILWDVPLCTSLYIVCDLQSIRIKPA